VAEPTFLREIRESYDTVADSYCELLRSGLDGWPLGRAMLGVFAELVRGGGGGPVLDVGCGPGHTTAHLRSLGLPVSGIDLSAGMIQAARREHPDLRFDVGSMTALASPDGELAGVVAVHSVIHLPPEAREVAFTEFHRTLSAGGHLLVTFHVGDGRRRKTTGYGGHVMGLDIYYLQPDSIADLATKVGLEVRAQLVEEPHTAGGARQACLLFRKPATA
jgi:SAM-dependent methyltransferase